MKFDTLQKRVEALGLGRVAPVDLQDPRFERGRHAYEAFLRRGFAGEMDYLHRNQELRKYPEKLLPGAQSALVFATAYRGQAANIARYAQGQDYHLVLRSRIQSLVEALQQDFPEAGFLIAVDTKPVLERSLAQVSGIGFIGKHGCIIVPGAGSYVFLSVLLTTLPADTWKEPETDDEEVSRARLRAQDNSDPWDRCAQCRACLDACPTQAFAAPGVLDARRCISYLTIEYRGEIAEDLAENIGERIVGCDRCQEVCPYNASPKREERENPQQWLPPREPEPLPVLQDASVLEIAAKGSNQYKRWVRGSALNRIPRLSMLRNICVYLGNLTELDAQARDFLEQAEEHENVTVARAARWALARHPSGPS